MLTRCDEWIIGYSVPREVENPQVSFTHLTNTENYTIANLKPYQIIFAIVCTRIGKKDADGREHCAYSDKVRTTALREEGCVYLIIWK